MDDLATVWCEWCEMELRHKNFKRALELMRRATAAPPRPRKREVRLAAMCSLCDTVHVCVSAGAHVASPRKREMQSVGLS